MKAENSRQQPSYKLFHCCTRGDVGAVQGDMLELELIYKKQKKKRKMMMMMMNKKKRKKSELYGIESMYKNFNVFLVSLSVT